MAKEPDRAWTLELLIYWCGTIPLAITAILGAILIIFDWSTERYKFSRLIWMTLAATNICFIILNLVYAEVRKMGGNVEKFTSIVTYTVRSYAVLLYAYLAVMQYMWMPHTHNITRQDLTFFHPSRVGLGLLVIFLWVLCLRVSKLAVQANTAAKYKDFVSELFHILQLVVPHCLQLICVLGIIKQLYIIPPNFVSCKVTRTHTAIARIGRNIMPAKSIPKTKKARRFSVNTVDSVGVFQSRPENRSSISSKPVKSYNMTMEGNEEEETKDQPRQKTPPPSPKNRSDSISSKQVKCYNMSTEEKEEAKEQLCLKTPPPSPKTRSDSISKVKCYYMTMEEMEEAKEQLRLKTTPPPIRLNSSLVNKEMKRRLSTDSLIVLKLASFPTQSEDSVSSLSSETELQKTLINNYQLETDMATAVVCICTPPMFVYSLGFSIRPYFKKQPLFWAALDFFQFFVAAWHIVVIAVTMPAFRHSIMRKFRYIRQYRKCPPSIKKIWEVSHFARGANTPLADSVTQNKATAFADTAFADDDSK